MSESLSTQLGSPSEERDSSQDASPSHRPRRSEESSKSPLPSYETVAEAPGIPRRVLLRKPFEVFSDILDASSDRSGRTESRVPAMYYVIDANNDGRLLHVGHEDGSVVGWINREKCGCLDWNVPNVYLPDREERERGSMSVYALPDEHAKRSVAILDGETVLMIVEAKDGWWRLEPLSTKRKATTHSIDAWRWGREKHAYPKDTSVLVSERELKRFDAAVESIVKELELLSGDGIEKGAGFEKFENLHRALGVAYLRLLGCRPCDQDATTKRLVGGKNSSVHYQWDRMGVKSPDVLQPTPGTYFYYEYEKWLKWLKEPYEVLDRVPLYVDSQLEQCVVLHLY